MLKKHSNKIVKKILASVEKFFSFSASAGIMLLISALVALLWANSPYADFYYKILHYHIGFSIGTFSLSLSLHHWVNDALMVIFFFVVGLEIKRELTVGELASPKKAALPIFAAVGGMLAPALFYLLFNPQGVVSEGWAIPMATDIAFAVGVLSLAGKRAPLSLKVFLLALAIVDDLGAVLVIAFFYSQSIASGFLAFALLMVLVIFLAKAIGIRSMPFYVLCGIGLWFFVLKSGVHSTVAGVLLGLMCPSRPPASRGGDFDATFFFDRDSVKNPPADMPPYKEVGRMARRVRDLYSPAHRLIEDLHPYVTWFIMPVFAFFNAGVALKTGFSFVDFVSHPVSLGILFGLLLGKPVGILLFSYLAVRLNLAVYPSGFNWKNLTGVGFLAGIGFTMALFISHLSFAFHPEQAMYAKLSILLASLLAMLLGLTLLFLPDKKKNNRG